MNWKSVPRFAKCSNSQAPSPHFSLTGRWTGTGILAEERESATQKERDNLHMTRYLFPNIQQRPGLERCVTAKPALASKSMISKCFKSELLHLLWGEPTGERQHTVKSLQLADHQIIKKINPVSSLPIHYWSIFKGSDFQSAGGYHYLDKLLDKAGVLVRTDQMLIQQQTEEDAQHWETKACFCLQTRESDLLDPSGQTHLPRQLSCFFHQQRHKGAYRRKMGKFLLSRQMFKTQRDSSLSLKGPLRACSMLITDWMPNFQVFSK